jgi:hypothetical protein
VEERSRLRWEIVAVRTRMRRVWFLDLGLRVLLVATVLELEPVYLLVFGGTRMKKWMGRQADKLTSRITTISLALAHFLTRLRRLWIAKMDA